MLTNSEIGHYVQKRKEGWDNSQVRKELSEQGYSKEDIFTIINEIDDAFILSVEKRQAFSFSNVSVSIVQIIVGIIILLIGVYLLAVCFIVGPSVLGLVLGASFTSGGYYLYQNGYKNTKMINELRKKNSSFSKDILDS